MPNRKINGDAPIGSMPPADLGVLRERVYNVERNAVATQNELHEIRSIMATTEDIRSLQNTMASIITKLDQVGKVQWPALSVGVTILALLGALVYWPIREAMSAIIVRADKTDVRLEKIVDRIDERIVSRSEHVERWRQFELADSRRKSETDDLRRELMPRPEIAGQVNGLQRQIDELRRDAGSIITARDILQTQARQIEEMQKDLRGLMAQRINGTRAP